MTPATLLASPLFAAILLFACQYAPPRVQDGEAQADALRLGLSQSATPLTQALTPPAGPGPTFGSDPPIAAARVANTSGLTRAQIETMFTSAVAQARPSDGKTAVCAAMQGLEERAARDAPPAAISFLSTALGLPAVPASQCGFHTEPFVTATGARAMLYTVRVETRRPGGSLIFWAVATYGNLGSSGAQFRLVRRGGRWEAVRTGLSVMS